MCFTSVLSINLRMQVTKWPNIFMDQGQFSDPGFISGTHQKEDVQFADKTKYPLCFYKNLKNHDKTLMLNNKWQQ